MNLYVDSSAVAKILVSETESEALARYLDDSDHDAVSSMLLETELRRMAARLDMPQALVTEVLDRIALVEPARSIFAEAGILAGTHLRSLDALHVATALRLDVAALVTYDVRLGEAADAVGIPVVAPA